MTDHLSSSRVTADRRRLDAYPLHVGCCCCSSWGGYSAARQRNRNRNRQSQVLAQQPVGLVQLIAATTGGIRRRRHRNRWAAVIPSGHTICLGTAAEESASASGGEGWSTRAALRPSSDRGDGPARSLLKNSSSFHDSHRYQRPSCPANHPLLSARTARCSLPAPATQQLTRHHPPCG